MGFLPDYICSGIERVGVIIMNEFERQRKLKEKEFLEYVREVCAGCHSCGSIDLKEHMMETGTDIEDRIHYLCSDCFSE